MSINITDGIVTLRALEPSDVDILYRWENDPEVWRHGDRRAPLSRHQLWEYVTNYDANPFSAGQLRLMMVDVASGDTVGAVDMFDIEPVSGRAQVGILVSQHHRGDGYGLRALQLLCRYAANELCLHQLWCLALADNDASRALFEAAGFSISGRLRSWQKTGTRYTDAYLYQKLLV